MMVSLQCIYPDQGVSLFFFFLLLRATIHTVQHKYDFYFCRLWEQVLALVVVDTHWFKAAAPLPSASAIFKTCCNQQKGPQWPPPPSSQHRPFTSNRKSGGGPELASDLRPLFSVGAAKTPLQRIQFPFISVTPLMSCTQVQPPHPHPGIVSLQTKHTHTHTVKDVHTHIWTHTPIQVV